MQARQVSLFGHEPVRVDAAFSKLSRIALDETAWIDHLPAWVRGHQALMDDLERTTRWQSARRAMYDRMVDVPRLLASIPEDGPGHPVLEDMRGALSGRYATELPNLTLALYRDGRDSVALHGDQIARTMPEALVVTVSLGEPRRFLLRKKTGGASMAFNLGWGDLVVMGGSSQRTWQHGVPKAAHAGPRMVVMFRPSGLEQATSHT